MAKIVITIEDKPGNRVKTTIEPSFATLSMKIKNSLTPLTSAEGYGIMCINKIMAESKNLKEPTKIIIPRLRDN